MKITGLKKLGTGALAAAGALALSAAPALAADAPKLDTGDTAWMLTSTALVLMMTIPGLGLFYGSSAIASPSRMAAA
jgi:Amt family ammonium transporter